MIKQKTIAIELGLSRSYISQIINGFRRPSWKNAKRLAEFTCTSPELWLEGSPEQIKSSISSDGECPRD